LLNEDYGIPALPEYVELGIPADLLRRRPDVRQAELNALAHPETIHDHSRSNARPRAHQGNANRPRLVQARQNLRK